jgi:MscS family membrane protein
LSAISRTFRSPVTRHDHGHRSARATAVRGVRRIAAWLFIVISFLLPVAAQLPGGGQRAATTSREHFADLLGRTTPRGTIVGFIRAAGRNDYASASRYLQPMPGQRGDGEALARDLKALMDRHYSQAITSISDAPEGDVDDGLPMDRERVGPLTIGARKIEISLVRVVDPQVGPIWLISSETLADVPALRRELSPGWIERTMPAPLLGSEVFGLSPAHWIVLLATLIIPFVVLRFGSGAGIAMVRSSIEDPRRRRVVEDWHAALRWPAVTALTLTVHLASLLLLEFPLTFRVWWLRVAAVPTIIAFAWLLRRVLALGFARARGIASGRERRSTRSLMLLGEHLVQALIIVAAVLTVLSVVGIDTSTALAGLGIGGIALALGAQKTIENLLGGIFLLSDRALAVGDLCRVDKRLGRIEDITLRSVRLRTQDDTLVSMPAGVLAQAGIENYATRHKMLVQQTLRLQHGTPAEQIRRILDGVRGLVHSNPRIETGSSRIHLVNFGEQAVELELFGYVLTTDMEEFMAAREALLLEVAGVVEAAGSGFAQPARIVYLDADGQVSSPKATRQRVDAAAASRGSHEATEAIATERPSAS